MTFETTQELKKLGAPKDVITLHESYRNEYTKTVAQTLYLLHLTEDMLTLVEKNKNVCSQCNKLATITQKVVKVERNIVTALIELTKLSDEDMGGKNTIWQFDEKTQKLKFKKRYYNWSIARATLKERIDKFNTYFEKIIELQEAADEKLFCVILYEFKTHTFNSK